MNRQTSILAISLIVILNSYAREEPRPEDGKIHELDPFEYSVELDSNSILPTSTKSGALIGAGKNILDLSRSISLVTYGQIEDRNISSIEELDLFISGAYSSPIFGNIGVPIIRGDLGELYINGQRKAFNRNSFPISFNGVESVEAIKGAPNAVFGYGNATGGYINLTTKSPLWNKSQTKLRLTAGQWDQYTMQLDYGGPINSDWAIRVSLQASDKGSFYRLVSSKDISLYAAIGYRTDGFSWTLNAEYFDAEFTEIPGTNRPTQDLIDHGIYIQGESISSGGSFFGNTFTPTGTIRIDGSQILLAPGDGAEAEVFNIQSTAKWEFGDNSLVNRSYFERVNATRGSSYYFFSHLPESYTFENRTEYSGVLDWNNFDNPYVVGVVLRYEHRKSFVDIFNEYFNPFDITMDPDTFRYPLDQLFAAIPVTGTDGFAVPGGAYPNGSGGVTPSLSATLHSTLWNLGVFLQDEFNLTRTLSIQHSSRIDFLFIETKDPLPRAGFDAIQDSADKAIFSNSISLSYKPKENQTYYLALNSVAAVESSSSSGGFGLVGNEIKDEVLENNSELIETGMKLALLEDKLFLGTAVYYQKRNRSSPRSGLPDEIEIFGWEWDVLYQPSELLSFGFIGAYNEANYINGPVAGTPTTQAPFDPNQPNSTFPSPPLADYQLPGLPRWLVNLFGRLDFDNGLFLTGAIQFQSEQNLDLDGEVVIRDQIQLDLGIGYGWDNLEVRLDIFNLTDEFNWRPNATPFAGADLVTRELPRHVQLSIKSVF